MLRRCYDYVEAEALRTRLDAAGILAVINNAEAHLAFSYVGAGALGGVRLEVAPEDYDRAVQLLEDDETKAATLGPWICEACGEQNEATFEVCWNCQKPRDAEDQTGRLDEGQQPDEPLVSPPTATPPTLPVQHDNNPYRPVLLENQRVETVGASVDSEVEDAVRRAYVAAIFGAVLFPPLVNIYSVVVLVASKARMAHADPRYGMRVWLSWLINIVSIGLWTSVWLHQINAW